MDFERTGSPKTKWDRPLGAFDAIEYPQGGLSSQPGASSLHSRNPLSIDVTGKDVELIIPTLQLLEKRILDGLDGGEGVIPIKSSGRSLHKLQGALVSDWLQDDLNGAMRQVYERAANRRVKEISRITDIPDPLGKDDQPDSRSKQVETATTGKISSQLVIKSCHFCSDGGLFVAELRGEPNDDESGRRTIRDTVIISYVPKPHWHGTGLSITFRRAFEAGSRIHIPPSMKTFNVVPYDAEIVLLVKRNDLDGVRKLFQTGKASPTDVPPSGHSLLSVRITFAESLNLTRTQKYNSLLIFIPVCDI
jgi:hypothetical protein